MLIVDDHPTARGRLTEILDAEPDLVVCGWVSDVNDAMDAVGIGRPDVLVLDLSVDEGEGLELVRRLRQQFPRVRSLVYSMYDPELYAAPALRSGSHGYVAKTRPAQSVVTGIRSILRGGLYIDAELPAETVAQAPGAPSTSQGDVIG